MRIRILGSAAGGGVPQWNCRCPNCELARAGSPDVRPRTQSSVAISADGRDWFLLNVSPDIRQQILAFPPLGPPEGCERGQGIAGCVLTDAELDHTAGLLLLREGSPFSILTTTWVRQMLQQCFPVERLLAFFAKPDWQPAPWSDALTLRMFEVGRHVPRFVNTDSSSAEGSVAGLLIEDKETGGRLVYAPCVGSISESLVGAAQEADVILIDGTFWSDDEPLRFGKRTALQMGHVPVSGPQGTLAWLADLPVKYRVYVHINNTNPMLNESGPEYRCVKNRGVQVGADGDMFEV
jgi:pyrroloquinoline quinone biosynthesis protein B